MSSETGKVKWFNQDKGYGFIVPDDGTRDVFVHVSELQKGDIYDIKENMSVSYELSESRGKTCAIEVSAV